MANTIQGNAQAVNARLRLRSVNVVRGEIDITQRVYTNSSGAYSFVNVQPGTYQIVADLSECTTAPYNQNYSFRESVVVTMDASGDNLVDVNLTPVLLNAANPGAWSR